MLLYSFAGISFAEEYKCDYTDKELNTNLYRLLINKKVDNKHATGVICITKDEGQIEIIKYNNEKKTIAKVYASDYNTYFKYNTISGNLLQNKHALKEIINSIDFTQILFDPENTNNKMLEIVIKDKKGTATFYYENNIVNYIVPITENGISNIGKYYNENGNFVADINTENGYITEIKCAGGRKINPTTMDNVSHIQYLCR